MRRLRHHFVKAVGEISGSQQKSIATIARGRMRAVSERLYAR
jgi:hypothetical protein